MRKRRSLVGAAMALCLAGSMLAGTPAAGDEELQSSWSEPFAESELFAERPPQTPDESKQDPPAVSMVVLPDGRILYWGGLESLEDSAAPLALDAGRTATLSRSRILDLSDGEPKWTVPGGELGETGAWDDHDMFCADQRLLPDGRVIVAGGTIWRNDPVDLTPFTGDDGPGGTAELFGSNATRIFDPADDTFSKATDASGEESPMAYGRWYPTLLTLNDGRMFVASGVERLLYNDKGLNVHQTEIFDPATGEWSENGPDGETTLPLFARMHLLPDGKVFYGSVGQMWSPFGQAVDQALWNLHKMYDVENNVWEVSGRSTLGARSGALSVLLPLRPDQDGNYTREAQILVGGGTLGVSPGSYIANDMTEIITVLDGASFAEQVAPLNNNRWYSSGVLLPDGSVVAVSGADQDEVIAPGFENPVHQAELFDGEKWVALESASRDRTYHNAAVLLADGRVLVGGHSPINALYGPTGDNTGHDLVGTANNMKDPSFEILEPPYLFKGDRPKILGAPAGITWSGKGLDESLPEPPPGDDEGDHYSFDVTVDDTADVDQVVLVRLPSTTHVTDADMRAVELVFDATDGDTLEVFGPPDANFAPPGYYYLFVLKDGVPSKARIVNVGATTDDSAAVAPMGI